MRFPILFLVALTACGDDSAVTDGGSDATTNDAPATNDVATNDVTVSDANDAAPPQNDAAVDATTTDGGVVCGDIPDGGATCNGTFFECDDNADCPGQVCCLQVANNVTGSSCKPSCKNGAPQMCAGNADCGDASACTTKTCKGYVFGVCGSPTACQ